MSAAGALLVAVSAPAAALSSYLLLLTLLSRRARAPRGVASSVRFEIIVPAHDEAAGIASTVASLRAIDYPEERFRVVVVADNCADDTAARAAAAGAEVLVRDEPLLRGKGYALALAFRRAIEEGRADAVVVVDADSVVSPNLLRAFAARIEAGASAVQAEYGVENADESWRTRLMTIAFSCVHALRSRARSRLGVSVGLHGNGMCFSTRVLAAVPYDAFSIVEDLEYGVRLGASGYRVFYAGEAEVRATMPVSARASGSQRVRWEAGRAAMVREHAARLLVGALRSRDPVLLDLGLELVVPPLGRIAAIVAAGLAASAALSWQRGAVAAGAWIWLGCAGSLVLYTARGWQLSGTGVRGLAALVRAPAFVVWKAVVLARARLAGAAGWVRTPRRGEEAS